MNKLNKRPSLRMMAQDETKKHHDYCKQVADFGNYHLDTYCTPYNTNSRPLPPFGEEAALLLSRGVTPRNDIFIFAGLYGWPKAKSFRMTQVVLCLPYGEDPTAYAWPVKDCAVLLINTGFLTVLQIEEFSYCLLCENAAIVRVILPDKTVAVYRRSAT